MNWSFGESKLAVAGQWGVDRVAPWVDELKHKVGGPWGGDRGVPWDDGVYSTVRQLVITSSAVIHSIQVEYDQNGRSVWCKKHGGDHGVKKDKIKLDYPTEFFIAISGRCGSVAEGGGPVIIKSLSFESNRRKYGPFGIEQGVSFSFAVSGAKLVGFYGCTSSYLDSIGVYVVPLVQNNFLVEKQRDIVAPRIDPFPVPMGYPDGQIIAAPPVTAYLQSGKKVVSFGPWGGKGKSTFDDGIYTGVREVIITSTAGLVSLTVCYDHNGKPVWGSKNGGTGGLKLEKIVFDFPFEVLTHITGYYGSTIFRGPTIIKSITFHTNKRSYGPFGDEQGFSFSSGSRGAIVGFHGSNGYFINGIGVHVLEGAPQNWRSPYPDPFDMSTLKHSEIAWGLPKGPSHLESSSLTDPGLYESGPWGGEGGMPWDDGAYRGIRKILLTKEDAICSIQIEYDLNGRFVWTPRHGKANDSCTYQVKFDYPKEVLTCISGYYDTIGGDWQKRVIRSLTFHTNKAKYGPYGKTIGTHFSSANKDGKIAGFHGRSSDYLDAIGVHMQY